MSSVTSVRLALAAALVVSSGSFNPALAAASAAGTMDVNLAIVSGCDFTATDMDFGIHNVITKHLFAQATLTIACTPGVSYVVGFDKGTGKDANEFQRRLTGVKNPDKTVIYNLSWLDNFAVFWGSGTESLVSGLSVAAWPSRSDGTTQTKTIYGRVPVPGTLPPDTYTDIVGITLTY